MSAFDPTHAVVPLVSNANHAIKVVHDRHEVGAHLMKECHILNFLLDTQTDCTLCMFKWMIFMIEKLCML